MSIRRNTVINMAGAVVPTIVMLVTVPPYLRLLGEARYGVLALVWLVLGYFGFLEMGLGKATSNQIAKAHDASGAERSEIFWSALLLNAGMGTIGALILWLAGDRVLAHLLAKSPADFQQEVMAALPWMIGTLPLALVSSVLTGALEGRNRFLAVNLLQVAGNLLFQIIPLGVAYRFGANLNIVIPTAIGVRVLMNVPFFVVCYRDLPLSLLPNFSIRRARSLFSFGGWVAVTGMIGPVIESADRFLIGLVAGAKSVAYYTVALQLATKMRILPASLTRALFPSFSADAEKGQALARSALAVLAAIMTPVIVLALLLVRPFLFVWLDKDVAAHSVPIAQILLLGTWANSLAYVPYSYLQGIGKPDHVAKLHLVECLPFLAVLYWATRSSGASGAAFAWTGRVALDFVLLFTIARLGRISAMKLLIPFGFVLLGLLVSSLEQTLWVQLSGGAVLAVGLLLWVSSTPLGAYVFDYVRRTRHPKVGPTPF